MRHCHAASLSWHRLNQPSRPSLSYLAKSRHKQAVTERMADEPSQVLALSIGAVSSLESINISSVHEPQNGQSQEHLV